MENELDNLYFQINDWNSFQTMRLEERAHKSQWLDYLWKQVKELRTKNPVLPQYEFDMLDSLYKKVIPFAEPDENTPVFYPKFHVE